MSIASLRRERLRFARLLGAAIYRKRPSSAAGAPAVLGSKIAGKQPAEKRHRRTAPEILRLGKNAGELAFSLGLFVSLAAPKILPLGNAQINLALPSLIHIFVDLNAVRTAMSDTKTNER